MLPHLAIIAESGSFTLFYKIHPITVTPLRREASVSPLSTEWQVLDMIMSLLLKPSVMEIPQPSLELCSHIGYEWEMQRFLRAG